MNDSELPPTTEEDRSNGWVLVVLVGVALCFINPALIVVAAAGLGGLWDWEVNRSRAKRLPPKPKALPKPGDLSDRQHRILMVTMVALPLATCATLIGLWASGVMRVSVLELIVIAFFASIFVFAMGAPSLMEVMSESNRESARRKTS